MNDKKFKPEIKLERKSVIPLRAQIVEQIRKDIIRNRLPAGMRLISERQLADELEINRNTVHQAYEQLASEDILAVSGVRGGGMVISETISGRYRAPFPSLNLILPYKFSEQLKLANLRGLEIIAGIMDRAAELHISVNVLNLADSILTPRETDEWLESFIPRSIGIITLGIRSDSFDPIFEELLKNRTLPHVFVSAISSYPHVSSITVDLIPAARKMLKTLYAYGHRSLGIVATMSSPCRQFQNCAFLRGNLISREAEKFKIRTTPVLLPDARTVDPADSVNRILALAPRPTALWIQNDEIAEQIIFELERRGLHVPGDFSVIGYDNTGKMQELSTFDHSRFKIGVESVNVIAELFDHGAPGDALNRTVESEFILRNSLAMLNTTGET